MEDKDTGGIADVKIEPVETAAPPKVPLKRQVRPLKGVVVYCNKERGYMGFECDGHGYQVPVKDGYAVGDTVKFKIVDGKIELCK